LSGGSAIASAINLHRATSGRAERRLAAVGSVPGQARHLGSTLLQSHRRHDSGRRRSHFRWSQRPLPEWGQFIVRSSRRMLRQRWSVRSRPWGARTQHGTVDRCRNARACCCLAPAAPHDL